MNKIYDNGTCLLGKVKQIKETIGKQTSEDKILIEIYAELDNILKIMILFVSIMTLALVILLIIGMKIVL